MKTSSLIFRILLSCTVIFFSVNCGKRCKKDVVEKILIPQEILDYVDFKTGSYWIYQDSATGRLDSVVVLSSHHVMENDSAINDCGDFVLFRQFENIEIAFKHYDPVSGSSSDLWIERFNTSYEHENDFIIYDNWFTIGFPIKDYSDAGYHNLEYMTDSLVVPGNTFKSVLVVKHTYINGPPDYALFSYFVKKIGCISNREYSTPTSFYPEVNYLIRYKIIQ